MKEKGREVKKKTRNGVTEKERKNKRRMMRKIKLRIKEKRKEEGQDVEDKGQRGGCWFESCLSLHVLWVQQSHLSALCF